MAVPHGYTQCMRVDFWITELRLFRGLKRPREFYYLGVTNKAMRFPPDFIQGGGGRASSIEAT